MLRIKGGKVYDPANGVNGEVRDVCVCDGRIVADVEAGRYHAKPTRVFRFEDIREAHRVMESNEAKGKMVVVI